MDVSKIRFRAERRIGELMEALEKTVGFNGGGRSKTGLAANPISTPTLIQKRNNCTRVTNRLRFIASS